jgi:hypothetical protein
VDGVDVDVDGVDVDGLDVDVDGVDVDGVDVDVDGVDVDGVDVDVDGVDVDVSGPDVDMGRMIGSDLSDLDLDFDLDVELFFQSSASRLASVEIDSTAGLFASALRVLADTTADIASMPG